MARAISSEHMTPADELRELLVDSETLVANLRGQGADPLELLENMDRINELWPQLEAAGMDLRPEAGRWESLQARVRSSAPALLGDLKARGGLAALRQKQYGSSQAPWWWYLDQQVRAERMRRLKKAALVTVAVVAGGAALILILGRLFPVDPKVQASMSAMLSGQQKVQNDKNFEEALTSFQQATVLTPDDAETWLWLGATQQILGHPEEADASFRRARELVPDEVQFRLGRAPVYTGLGMLIEAKADLDAVVARDPENPQAYFYLTSVYEAQGDLEKATESLQKASDYAEARNMAELTALSRYRLALMLQQLQMMPGPPDTPTPLSP